MDNHDVSQNKENSQDSNFNESLACNSPDISKLARFKKSHWYWSKKFSSLISDVSIIFTVFSEADGKVFITLLPIVEAIEKVAPGSSYSLAEMLNLANPSYMYVRFKDMDAKNCVREKFVEFNGGKVYYVDNVLCEKNYLVRIYWLPLDVKVDDIKKLLTKFGDIIEIWQEKNSVSENRSVPINITMGLKMKLQMGVKPEDIPYIDYMNKKKVLITVKGRPPFCLKCNCVGHVRQDCPKKWCTKCRKIAYPQHECFDVELIKQALVMKNDFEEIYSDSEEDDEINFGEECEMFKASHSMRRILAAR